MNKSPMNAAELQDMIQKYREELMNANQKKTFSAEQQQQPMQMPTTPPVPPAPSMPPAPTFFTKAESYAEQTYPLEPVNDVQTMSGMPFARTFPVAPSKPSTIAPSIPENTNNTPPVFPLSPPNVYNTDTAPIPLQNPEPTTYWTPPCMQANYAFEPGFPAQDFTYTEQNLSDVFVNTPPQSPTSQITLAPADEPGNQQEDAVVTLSQFWPTPQEMPPSENPPEELSAQMNEAYDVPPCPSQYWPQAPEAESLEISNKSANQMPSTLDAEEKPEESDYAPPPSLIRPHPDTLPPDTENKSNVSLPPEPLKAPPDPQAVPDMGSALLQIHVSTGKKAKPVSGVRIIIFRPDGDREILLKIVSTDRDGHTPPIPLPAVEAKYSLHSGSPEPTEFTIETSVAHFCHTRHINVPLYGGVASVLEIELTPLAEGEDAGKELVYDHSLPKE